MNTATYVKTLEARVDGQIKKLYKLDPALNEIEYVVVSAIPCAFDTGEPETFIFSADETGDITSFSDLEGSFQGSIDIPKALKGLGYKIKKD